LTEKQKILIVDDKPPNLFSLEQILKATDAEIIQALNGNEALAASLNHEFALVLLDVQMPGMDGYELAEWLRSDERTKALPIIFVSAAYSSDYHVFKGYEAGAVDFMVKPYNPDILLSKVRVFLELNRQQILLKQSRQMLALANDTLEQRVQERTAELEEFAFVISHDLQEPLRMVSSFVQLLAKRYTGQLDENADTYINFAVDGANRMREMITSILQYSRINTTGMDCEWVDVNETLDRVLLTLSLRIKEEQVTLTRETFPPVWMNPTKLYQVFQNLIDNAIKFKRDVPLKIHISSPSLKDLPEAFTPPDAIKKGFQIFSIRDNGLGMEQQFAQRIFKVFQRLHGQDAYPGTGIGLSICKRIIERNGGRIWVVSQPGKGTTFYFTLRVHSDDACDK